MLRAYRTVPKELFRVNNGPFIQLRTLLPHEFRARFDIHTNDGLVLPKALNPQSYRPPNGASMRPNSPYQHYLMRAFKGENVVVYVLPKGTNLPEDLLLVHERSDHWSLQPATEMFISNLNQKITKFLQEQGEILSQEEWFARYPKPTEPSNFNPARFTSGG